MVLLRRRTLTVAAVAAAPLLASAGCGAADHPTGDQALAAAGGGADPDEALLGSALRAEQRLLADLVEVSRRLPRLRPALGEAVDVHRRHVQLLTHAVDAPRRATPGPMGVGRPDRALTELVRAERRLSEEHARRAVAASSGPFARVLAGMAAAAAQQAHVLSGVAAGQPGTRR